MSEIVPAIIADSYQELEEKIKRYEPHVSRVHIDIMDGVFVAHRTIDGPDEVDKLDTKLELEIHLMVQRPENKIVRWLTTKADKFLVHIESTNKFKEVIDLVKDEDKAIFAVLNPETSHDAIGEYSDFIDGVQFMTVHPGKHGAEFVEEVTKKIEDFHFMYPDLPIEVDGGIHTLTASKCIVAGASILAVGSHLLEDKGIEQALNELKNV